MLRHAPTLLGPIVLLSALLLACDSGDGGSVSDTGEDTSGAYPSGSVAVVIGEGIDFATGSLVEEASFGNADLYVVEGDGTTVELRTGGEKITAARPVNWFQTAGGVFQTFGSLDEVPGQVPVDDTGLPLLKAHVGNGFVLESAHGGWTKGWISSASGSGVTVSFEPLEL